MNKILEATNKNYKQFYEKVDMALNYLVKKYYNYVQSDKKERLFILEDLAKDLDKVSNLFNNYGYTAMPSNVDDVSENVFEELIQRYFDSFKDFVENGNSNLETININIKTLSILVDKHKMKSEHFV